MEKELGSSGKMKDADESGTNRHESNMRMTSLVRIGKREHSGDRGFQKEKKSI